MGDFSMVEFWTLLPWLNVTQHWQLMQLLQSLQTDNKYWNQWPILRSTCFSSRKSDFSSPMESNYSHQQFLVVCLWMSCSLMPLCVLWVSDLLNSLGELRVSEVQWWTVMWQSLLSVCLKAVISWANVTRTSGLPKWGTLIEGCWECFTLFLCNLDHAE